MTPRLRRFALTAHVIFSVGWLGAVAAYLALALAGLRGNDTAYSGTHLIGWFVIFPLSLASLLSGLVQSLGTEWGLLRHYWILVKWAAATLGTAILLVHMRTVSRVAALASEGGLLAHPDSELLRTQLVVHAAAGLLLLVGVTALSIYKPWGRTRYGLRKLGERRAGDAPAPED